MLSCLVFVVLTSACFYVADGDDTALGCDEGWNNANNQCYMFINNKKITWSQAEQECNRYDASLMYFDSGDEVNWYIGYVSNYPSAAYWTSLNDYTWRGINGPGDSIWKWGRYQQADITIVTWNQSPANDGRANCGGLTIVGNMSDVDCNSTQGYICNVELNGGKCPDNTWIQTPTDCYYVSNTSDLTQLMTWDAARAKCASFGSGSHLLTIDDANDQNFIQTAVPFVSQNAYLFWTGLVYRNNAWQWFNGATFNKQFFNWIMEPDNVAGKEDCAVVRYNGYFSDRWCNSLQNYICKKGQDYTDNTLNTGCGIWTRGGQYCFEFYTDPPSTWSDAKTMCQNMQGDLINVKDLDTMTWLQVQMLDPSNDNAFWTALNDRDVEGTYKWSDGTVIDPNVINWNSEPNDYRGIEDCAVLQADLFGVNDISCSFKAAPLCEVANVQGCPSKGGQWVSRPADSGNGLDCYLFGNFSNDNIKTQPEALRYCQSLATSSNNIPQLLILDTPTETQFIQNQLQNYRSNPVGYWTMLTDQQQEGYWTWGGNSLADQSVIPWLKEPNNATPNTDCSIVTVNGYFKVKDCNLKYGFICQRPSSLAWTSGSGRIHIKPLVLVQSLIFLIIVKLWVTL